MFHSYVEGDLAVLVAVERQHAEVGDLPAQEWSLRITLVFRREDGSGGWCTGTPTRSRGRSSRELFAALARGEHAVG